MAWKHPAKYEVTTENDYDGYPVYTLLETSKSQGKWVTRPIGKLDSLHSIWQAPPVVMVNQKTMG